MSSEIKIFETLLADIGESKFQSLVALQQLKIDGWQVHYVVDADLIGNYCFPEGIIKSRVAKERNLTDEYIMDEQATLFNLFNTTKPFPQGVILDEYIIEVRNMTSVALVANKMAGTTAEKFVQKWLMRANENQFIHSDIRSLSEDISNNFSSRIAELLFIANGLTKFENLLSQKLVNFESDSAIPAQIANLFERSQVDDQQFELIYKLFENNSGPLNHHSRKRDARAIQRIINLNTLIQSDSNFKKVIFVFVVDSPSITQQVFYQAYNSTTIKYPMVEGKRMPIFTTIQEIFAHQISKVIDDQGNEDFVQTCANIKELQKMAKKIDSRIENATVAIKDFGNSEIDDLFTGEYQYFFSKYKALRNIFENTGLFESMPNIYESLKASFRGSGPTHLLRYFKDVQGKQNQLQETLKDRKKLLNSLFDEVDFNSNFITALEEIKHNRTSWDWTKGQDPIEGTYQILPVFLSLSNYHGFADEINQLIRLVLGEEKRHDHSVYEVIKALTNTLVKRRSGHGNQLNDRILKAFIFLLLPFERSQLSPKYRSSDKDKMVYNWLKSVGEDAVGADYLYITCWAARRVKNYQDSIKLAKKGISKYPKDPRFYHGLALARYCLLESRDNKSINQIDEIIRAINESENLYFSFFKLHYFGVNVKNYMDKISANNNNSLCMLLAERAAIQLRLDEYDEGLKVLKEARRRLGNLKLNGEYRTKLPEYYDTEAYLEYVESFYTEEFEPKVKLQNALVAIEAAKKLTMSTELLSKYQMRGRLIQQRLDLFQ
ncbi:MAG: hypothetical protein ACO1N1_09285 [Dyadobacter fermentans]